MLRVNLTRKRTMAVGTLAEAASACRAYIDDRNLGGSRWTGGDVRDSAGTLIARVSYNGLVWPPEEWPICREGSLPRESA